MYYCPFRGCVPSQDRRPAQQRDDQARSSPRVTSGCAFVLKARWNGPSACSTAQTRMVSEGQLTVQAVPLRENAAGLELVTPFQVPLKPNPV